MTTETTRMSCDDTRLDSPCQGGGSYGPCGAYATWTMGEAVLCYACVQRSRTGVLVLHSAAQAAERARILGGHIGSTGGAWHREAD